MADFLEPELLHGFVYRLIARGTRQIEFPEDGTITYYNDRYVWRRIAGEFVHINQTIVIGSRWRGMALRIYWRYEWFGV